MTTYQWRALVDFDKRADKVLVQEGDAVYLARWRDGLWYDLEGHVLAPSAWMPYGAPAEPRVTYTITEHEYGDSYMRDFWRERQR
jgi:hypothetical protein